MTDIFMIHSCWIIPYNKSMRNRFASLFEKVVSRSLKSFFQLKDQVNICINLKEATALHHSNELAGLKPSRCTLSPISGQLCFMNIRNKNDWLIWCSHYINISDCKSRSAPIYIVAIRFLIIFF